MCGIVGVVCDGPCSRYFGRPVGLLIKERLPNLEYRGYDSVGFAIYSSGRLAVRKSRGERYSRSRGSWGSTSSTAP